MARSAARLAKIASAVPCLFNVKNRSANQAESEAPRRDRHLLSRSSSGTLTPCCLSLSFFCTFASSNACDRVGLLWYALGFLHSNEAWPVCRHFWHFLPEDDDDEAAALLELPIREGNMAME